jgi:hypothetical protein
VRYVGSLTLPAQIGEYAAAGASPSVRDRSTLNRKHAECGFDFRTSVCISFFGARLNAFLLDRSCAINVPEFLERLSAMEKSGHIRVIIRHQSFELRDGSVRHIGIRQLHR